MARYKEDKEEMAEELSHENENNESVVLKLLSEKDMYGYEMIKTLRKRSENVFEKKAGMLYPLLHGLEGDGTLNSYEQYCRGKMRKYYSIANGKKGEEDLDTQ